MWKGEFQFTYKKEILPKWNPTIAEAIKYFTKRREKDELANQLQENACIIDFLERLSQTSGRIRCIENYKEEQKGRKIQKSVNIHKINILVCFEKKEEMEEFTKNWKETLNNS